MTEEWIVAATKELDRLAHERYRSRMRATIIALVNARLAGEPEETVWKPRRRELGSRTTYQHSWKKNPLFVEVLANVESIARAYVDGRALRAKILAAERLALAAPVAVGVAIQEMKSEDASTRLRAAFGILDRAGVETATKQQVEVGIDSTSEIPIRVVDYRNGLAAIAPRSDEDSAAPSES